MRRTRSASSPEFVGGLGDGVSSESTQRLLSSGARTGSGERPLALVGPTAVGKSRVAVEIAEKTGRFEIVSADSMQVYAEMDVGTAKPDADTMRRVRHHLVGIVDPSEEYTVGRFVQDVREALRVIRDAGRLPLLVGGTGLYVQAVVDQLQIPGRWPEVRALLEADPDTRGMWERLRTLDPLAASRMEPTNRRRVIRALEVTLGSGRPFSSWGPGLDSYPETSWVIVGLRMERSLLDARIEERLSAQLAGGFLDEVRSLAGRPGGLSRTARQALGYRELLEHVEGGKPLEDCVQEIARRTRRFARRQERWFRRDPRVRWVEVEPSETVPELADRVLRVWSEACSPA
ncbi:MAG: tRNA dimethylallyltransferase [Acidimicrobiales bacterium]|nr:MAG: tRNA dimethylallyltransferase [Acidimicrobiales bacterium]